MFRARLQDAGTAALGALVAALVVLGCGGSGDTTTTATVTVGERTVTEPTPSTTPTIPTASLARRAERLVEQYYAAVDIGDYQSAWSLLSPELQSQLGGFYAWRDGYRFTIGTDVSGVRAIDGTAPSLTVTVNIGATDIDACGDEVHQNFAGTWTVESQAGGLLATDFDVDKISGGTPVRDVAACAPPAQPPAPPPSTSAGCDPNYSGCVPPYPPDVDCADVGETVTVLGSDPHGLDADGDGSGCE
jgi:hypothetical protein